MFKEVLESFKALGEMNLSEIERKKLHVVYQKLSSLQKRVEGVFDKHVMTKVEKQLAHFDADTRLRNLEEAFKNEKGFSDRWDAHMKIVELRLKKSEKDLTPKNKYEELLSFQAERFPPSPFGWCIIWYVNSEFKKILE